MATANNVVFGDLVNCDPIDGDPEPTLARESRVHEKSLHLVHHQLLSNPDGPTGTHLAILMRYHLTQNRYLTQNR